ncbi:hypothetical protein [Roseateles violae]|uniref:Lipoprotein n=1 Tax=Roseateles violae TaxID=3058042 RepID=A0ABT8DSD2_9BURK|nr:hypothetical protein [Pelomonas sp. PFR6]MDN3921235.1 hypothetical protein [Pelomonas sp. PFR6]
MMSKTRTSAAALLAALTLGACGGGTEVLVVPLFVFGFEGSAGGSTVQAFLLPDQPTTASGTLDTANFNVDGVQKQFGGTWSGCSLSLTLKPGQSEPAAPLASSYEGRLQGTDTLLLTPPAASGRPTLTLKRNGTVNSFGC